MLKVELVKAFEESASQFKWSITHAEQLRES